MTDTTLAEPAPIRRGFSDVAHGQMHFRAAGAGDPILVLHASPGSSKQMVRLISDLSRTHRVIAPDTAGNGDSDRLELDTPQITDLAAVLPAFLDSLALDTVDLYGSHTGAAIAVRSRPIWTAPICSGPFSSAATNMFSIPGTIAPGRPSAAAAFRRLRSCMTGWSRC
jgi:hypothetical protein